MTAMKKLMAGFWYEEKTEMFFSSGKGQADFILTLNKLEVGTCLLYTSPSPRD